MKFPWILVLAMCAGAACNPKFESDIDQGAQSEKLSGATTGSLDPIIQTLSATTEGQSSLEVRFAAGEGPLESALPLVLSAYLGEDCSGDILGSAEFVSRQTAYQIPIERKMVAGESISVQVANGAGDILGCSSQAYSPEVAVSDDPPQPTISLGRNYYTQPSFTVSYGDDTVIANQSTVVLFASADCSGTELGRQTVSADNLTSVEVRLTQPLSDLSATLQVSALIQRPDSSQDCSETPVDYQYEALDLQVTSISGASGSNQSPQFTVQDLDGRRLDEGLKIELYDAAACTGNLLGQSAVGSGGVQSLNVGLSNDLGSSSVSLTVFAKILDASDAVLGCSASAAAYAYTPSAGPVLTADPGAIGATTRSPEFTITSGDNVVLASGMKVRLYDAADCGGEVVGESNVFSSGPSATVKLTKRIIGLSGSVTVTGAILSRSDNELDCTDSALTYNFVACGTDEIASSTITVGVGSPDDPYIICNVDQLQTINDDLDAFYELGRDIDASSTSTWNNTVGDGFIPIGSCGADYDCGTTSGGNEQTPFTGSFNGNGFVISGLYIDRGHRATVGLFGQTSVTSVISDVELLGADITSSNSNGEHSTGIFAGRHAGIAFNITVRGSLTGKERTGGVAGHAYYGSLVQPTSYASVTGYDYVGGIAGRAYNADIIDSFNDGGVTGYASVGGIAGLSYSSKIRKAFNVGQISANSGYLGGIVGGQNYTYIYQAGNYGNIQGSTDVSAVGGLVGRSTYSVIYDSYNKGAIVGGAATGGMVGLLYYGQGDNYEYLSIVNGFNSGSITGTSSVGGVVGEMATSDYTTISNVLSAGAITATGVDTGGVIGAGVDDALISNVHWYDTDPQGGVSVCAPASYNAACTTVPVPFPYHDANSALYTDAGSPWDFVDNPNDGTADIWATAPADFPTFYFSPTGASPDFPGFGTKDQPYQILSPAHWNAIGKNVKYMDKHFLITTDLDFSATSLVPIGDAETFSEGFKGVLDGGGHTISGITYTETTRVSMGGLIFGAQRASVSNLKISDSTFTTNAFYQGTLIGRCENCTINKIAIENVTFNDRYTGSATYHSVGGIVGLLKSSHLINSFVHSSTIDVVSSVQHVLLGGLIGQSQESKLLNSYSSGQINYNQAGWVGGLIGQAFLSDDNHESSGNKPFQQVFSNMTITGPVPQYGVGGLMGNNQSNSFFFGYWYDESSDDRVTSCFANTSNNNCTRVGDVTGMYQDYHGVYTANRPWDFDYVWREEPSDFPRLQMFD